MINIYIAPVVSVEIEAYWERNDIPSNDISINVVRQVDIWFVLKVF